MSVKDSVLRYNLIIQKLSRQPSTLVEIQDYLERESHIQGYSFVRDKRTFKRDCESISDIYRINIVYCTRRRVYEIIDNDLSATHVRLLEVFDTLNALNVSDRISKHISFEQHKRLGTEFLYDLIKACKEKKEVCFDYQKFEDTAPKERGLNVFGIKEFNKRWYVIGRDIKDDRVKVFALERITNVRLQAKKFQENYSIDKHFENSFGIISPNGQKSEKVILSFEPYQAKYLKGIPLHSSQEIITDNESEFVIKLHVIPTFDFKMEILKYGSLVKVLEPDFFREEIKEELQQTLKQYD